MTSREITEWKAFFLVRAERSKPKAQSNDEMRAVFKEINVNASNPNRRKR